MEIKYNEATLNRPEGNRIIDAPVVFIDLNKYSRQLKEEETWQKNDRNGITVFKTDRLTIVLSCLHTNASIKHISVDGLLTIQVIEGTISLDIETGLVKLQKNELVTLHPGINHTITALEDSLLLMTNHVTI